MPAARSRPKPKTRPKRITELGDEALQEVLSLSSGSDSVELKLTVPETDHRSAIGALGLDPLDAQIRLVSFFDTPDLELNQLGLIVRARRVQGREDDTVVKLRPVVPADLPHHLRTSPGMFVELDAMPGGYVCSASMKARLAGDTDGQEGHARQAQPAQALLQGPARVLRRARSGGARHRRPHAARADLRAEGQVVPDAASRGRW